jgi:hypothetical protein
VADADGQAHHANQHVPLLLFARAVLTHSTDSTKKKMIFEQVSNVRKGGACCGNRTQFRRLLHHQQVHHHQSKKQVCVGNQRMLAAMICVLRMLTLLKNIFNIFNTWLAASDSLRHTFHGVHFR